MEIFVTPKAEKNFDSIVKKIHQKWGKKTSREFVQKTNEIFKLLINFPSMGQVEINDIRGFQLSPQTRILYRIRNEKIIILSFFEVRQDPKKRFGQ